MTQMNFGIADGDGNDITVGISPEVHARRVAQQMANERGESVWLYALPVGEVGGSEVGGSEVDSEEVEPESLDTCPKCHRQTTADKQHGHVRHAAESGDGLVHDGGCDACCACVQADSDMVSAVRSGGDRVLGSDTAEDVAVQWSDCGLTAEQASEYIAAGCWDAGRVLELVVAGVAADEIADLAADEDATSSIAYQHSNCDISTADVLAAISAVRS